MRYRMEVIRGFSLVDLDTNARPLLRNNSAILAVLALSAGPISRDDVRRAVWPDADDDAARNRLRVALNKLRNLAPGLIRETHLGLVLDSNLLSLDVWDTLDALNEADNAVTEPQEAEQLAAALAPLQDSHLEDYGSAASSFAQIISDSCFRAATLSLRLGKPSEAFQAAELGIRLEPSRTEHWENLLLSSAQIGKGPAAIKLARSSLAREALATRGIEEAIKLAQISETAAPEPFSRQSRLILELMSLLIDSRPDLCLPVFSCPESLALSGQFPKQMHDILERIVKDPSEKNEAWRRSMARLVGLKGWLNDVNGVLAYGLPLVEDTDDPAILRATWNAISIAYGLIRDWPRAFDAIDQTMKYAEILGNEINILSTQGNRAYFLMHRGDFEASKREYEASFDRLSKLDTQHGRFEYAIGYGNYCFIPLLQGHWSEAAIQMAKAIEIRSAGAQPIQLGLFRAGLALANARSGRMAEVADSVREGLIDAFQSESERFQQITFEFAAGALVRPENSAFAAQVLDWVNEWRIRTNLPRGEAEIAFCQGLKSTEQASRVPIQLGTPKEVGQLLMRLLRAEARP